MPGPNDSIMHAELTHHEALVMLGPENPQMGALAPQGPSPVTLYVYVDDVDEVTSRAKLEGGNVVKQPEDTFWGDRCAVVVDADGHSWMLATHVKDVPFEEMVPPSA
jgi:PhnB protein